MRIETKIKVLESPCVSDAHGDYSQVGCSGIGVQEQCQEIRDRGKEIYPLSPYPSVHNVFRNSITASTSFPVRWE